MQSRRSSTCRRKSRTSLIAASERPSSTSEVLIRRWKSLLTKCPLRSHGVSDPRVDPFPQFCDWHTNRSTDPNAGHVAFSDQRVELGARNAERISGRGWSENNGLIHAGHPFHHVAVYVWTNRYL